MALLAEELVEEWLNRQGYFTIRGVKIGVHEMDLLAVRPMSGVLECRHLEVQVSVNPVSYLTRLSKQDQAVTGRSANSSKTRTEDELRRGADEWVEKKFDRPSKADLLRKLAPGLWSKELVVHRLKHPEELDLLRERGVTIHQFDDILSDLAQGATLVERASGGDFLDLVFLGRFDRQSTRTVIGAADEPEDGESG